MPKVERATATSSNKPALARAEVLDKTARARIESELDAALKRKLANEPKLAGCARALAPLSAGLRATLGDLATVMIRRGSFKRETYSAAVRSLADADDRRLPAMLKTAFATEKAGGHAAFSAACFSRDPSLANPLAKIASSRQSHLAFGAETARVVRGESNGSHLTQLAPMIKESHRLSLCAELFVPLARFSPDARVSIPRPVAPALSVLRGAERHLGRWLVLAEVAARSGDAEPMNEAVSKATEGPSSSRAAWSLVRWALAEGTTDDAASPDTRPTVELVARLSDRPSADRDPTFLFRLARARATVVRPMLETFAKTLPLADETSIRAALFLARDHAREDLREALVSAATAPKREELRGLAVAALFDVGARDQARDMSDELVNSKHISNVAWGAVVRAAAAQRRSQSETSYTPMIVTETRFPVDSVGLGRIERALYFSAVLAIASLAARDVVAMPPDVLQIAVDRDDDDLDGRVDSEQNPVPAAARANLISLGASLAGDVVRPIVGGNFLRVIGPDGKVVAWGSRLPREQFLQGISPGRAILQISRNNVDIETRTFDVVGLGFRDGTLHDLDLSKERASLERLPPERAPASADARYEDFDALRATLIVSDGARNAALGQVVEVESISAAGATIDRLEGVSLERTTPCPEHDECYATEPLRFVVDDVDRTHPLVERRSLRAEVGGAVVIREGSAKQMIRVEGPRASAVGPISRLRATVRPFVLRVAPKAGPALGGNDAGAVLTVRSELAVASAAWGQCGITFGKTDAIDIKVVDPPPNYLLAFGDDLGLPASGGTVRVRIDGKIVSSVIAPGSSPLVAARGFSKAAQNAGFSAVVSPNVRIVPAAEGSVDVLVHDGAALAHIEPLTVGARAADDSSMVVRIGSVDLSDGLFHFGDMDSMAGTLEERTMIKAFDDGDPTTIELFFIPAFGGGDRIGESFIQNDMSSVRDLVLIDRAGVRARRMSSTLAHEIGHVLMNAPGHPDDYGLDTPTLLMDSDGADASPFGPRRLTIDECARAVRESGPKSRVPLLGAWPITPLKVTR